METPTTECTVPGKQVGGDQIMFWCLVDVSCDEGARRKPRVAEMGG